MIKDDNDRSPIETQLRRKGNEKFDTCFSTISLIFNYFSKFLTNIILRYIMIFEEVNLVLGTLSVLYRLSIYRKLVNHRKHETVIFRNPGARLCNYIYNDNNKNSEGLPAIYCASLSFPPKSPPYMLSTLPRSSFYRQFPTAAACLSHALVHNTANADAAAMNDLDFKQDKGKQNALISHSISCTYSICLINLIHF